MTDRTDLPKRRGRRTRLVALGLAALVVVLRLFFFELHVVSGVSMWPGFCPDGASEWVLVYRSGTPPGRDKLVIVSDPEGATVLKRQIAAAGESPRIIDGDVLVDGRFLERDSARICAQRIPVLSIRDLRWATRGDRRTLVGPLGRPAVVPLAGRASLSDDGAFLLIEADDSGTGSVRIPEGDIRDDHRSASGRIVSGKRVVRDVLVTFAAHRWLRGRTLRIEQWLEDGEHPQAVLGVRCTEDGLLVEMSGRSNPATGKPLDKPVVAGPYPASTETVFRWILVDGKRVLQVKTVDEEAFHDVATQVRSSLPGPFQSHLKLVAVGGSVVLSRLDIDRDIHYTPPPGGQGSGAGGTHHDIPPETVYVLGDNSPESRDSRHWPPLSRTPVRGRPILVVWPRDRMRWIED